MGKGKPINRQRKKIQKLNNEVLKEKNTCLGLLQCLTVNVNETIIIN